jgi:hypothetical protein
MEKKYGWRIGTSRDGEYSLWKIRDNEVLQLARHTFDYVQLDESECPDYEKLKRYGTRTFMQVRIKALKNEIKDKANELDRLEEELTKFDYGIEEENDT